MKNCVKYSKLKEICLDFIVPQRDKPKSFDGTIPWCRIEDIEGKYLNGSKSNQNVSKELADSMNMHICPQGTVICACSASIGNQAITTIDCYTNQTFIGIVVNPTLLFNEYLYYFFSSQKENLQKMGRGATIKYISREKFENLIIPVPPLVEQERIVAELDLISSIIDKKKAQLKHYDALAQSIFYDMFGDPKQWENRRLKDVTVKMGSGATPRGGNQSYKNEGISLIRSLNVHNGIFKNKDLAHIDESQAAQLNNVIVEKDDVLLNITGASVARCCIVPSDILPARVNQHVSILRPNIHILNNVFLCHYLISDTTQEDLILMSKSKAATREALPKSILENFSIPLPPLSLQQEFAEKIEAIEKQKSLIQQSIKETEILFNSRMDYYFN